MSSKIEIANVALVRLRANTIQSLSDGSTESGCINALWDDTRRALLSLHTWNFALKETELAATTETKPLEQIYRYQLPSDNVRIVKVFDDLNYRAVGNQIYTDKPTCLLRYVSDQTDTAAWSPLFTDLMAARLAWELAYPITANQTTANALQAIYEQKLKDARFNDSTQDIPEPFAQGRNSLMNARF